jgi:2'-5' RNA ligase
VLIGTEGVSALREFQGKLLVALQKAGGRCRSGSNFAPHITLLYDDHIVPEHPVEPVSWTVPEFVLIHSLLGKTCYIPVARFPLRD